MHTRRVVIVTCIATILLGVTSARAGGRADHLMCYKMTDALQINAAVDMIADLQPRFTQRGCTLVKPVEFCVPATKQNVQPPPTANELIGQPLRDDYVCYAAKCNETAPPNQIIADQFGVRPESKFKATKVCVPARKFPIRCAAAGSRTCGGVCPPDLLCKAAAAGGCTCQPDQCGGAPDKQGVCGGTCPDSEVCRLTTPASGRVACTCQKIPPPPCGNNPLTGSCGGECTDPTLKCLPDADGQCDCRTAPDQFCGALAGGGCGGPCPNPADVCTTSAVDPNKPCVCEPGPCHQDPFTGACTGTCDPAAGPGGTCHLDANNQCTCGPPPCGLDPATGECGGVCPPNSTCAPDAANHCGCSSPCRFDAQNVCGGSCPPGEVCAQQGPDCLCTQPPPCAFGAETAGFCSGACPPGKSCHTKKINKSTLACLCLDN